MKIWVKITATSWQIAVLIKLYLPDIFYNENCFRFLEKNNIPGITFNPIEKTKKIKIWHWKNITFFLN